MLAALLTNLASGEPVWKKQQKGKRPLDAFTRQRLLDARVLRVRETKERTQLAEAMRVAVERLQHLDTQLPQLSDAVERVTSRYRRRKVMPIRPGIAVPAPHIDYQDLAASPLAVAEMQRLLEWLDEEETLMLLLLA